jgi:phosphate transport system substrate-binding protein
MLAFRAIGRLSRWEFGTVKRRNFLSASVLLGAAVGVPASPQETHAASEIHGSAPLTMSRLIGALRGGLPGAARFLNVDLPYGPPIGRLSVPLTDFLRGRSDFAFQTREISEEDLQTYRSHHHGEEPMILPVAAGNWSRFGYTDAVVFVVHPVNPLRSISLVQIDALLSTTRLRGSQQPILTWGDLGLAGEWVRRPVQIAGGDAWVKEESARALTVRRHVLSTPLRSGQWLRRPGTGGDADVVTIVSSHPAAIGFTGRGHVQGLKCLTISADDGTPVELNETTARSGAYPLLRTIDLLMSKHARGEVLALASLLLSEDAQNLIAGQGDFLPLPRGVLENSRSLVSSLKESRQGWHGPRIGG